MKKSFMYSAGIALILMGWGCTSATSNITPTSKNALDNSADSSQIAKDDLIQKNQIVQGTARLSKGDQIIVNDIFLSEEQVKQTSLTEEQLDGKIIKMKGDITTQYCDIHDQCISNGTDNYVKFIQNLEYIKIIE
ncbi:MAG: hypothetical protein WCW16_02635 [Candidatus Magasanikbacteria bacterium]